MVQYDGSGVKEKFILTRSGRQGTVLSSDMSGTCQTCGERMSVAVVTGSASGIGAAITRTIAGRFAEAEIVGWDIAGAAPVDVGSTASVQTATAALPGPVRHVVLAAGVSRMALLTATTDEDWDFQFRVNTFGVFNCLRSLVPVMEDGGAIVVIDSMAGLRGAPLLSAYSASKFAVTGLIEAATPEFAVRGIRINGVCPMYVRTPMQHRELRWEADALGSTPEEVFDGYVRATPIGRVAEPEDVADTVAFLLGDDSRYMTGSMLTVSGGAHLGMVYRPKTAE
jgi:meso-butanediol dehydrogenase / (S,S)-butanediol dehydrogenase / diacetyl reductase